MKSALLLIGVLMLMAVFFGCSSPSNTTPSLTHVTTSPSSPTTAAASTFGELAQSGQLVYGSKCAGCHGNNGQGASARALWGPYANLSRYNDAGELLSFIGAYMPSNAPGSLPAQNYIDVLCYLLIQNNDVSAGTVFNQGQLSGIALK